ncbi:MAG TPA: serine/threonine-protein kinase [Blastocatellia bacterium]|nr:serine/threonine-protein kinase [Blastocatellia bacterium]
MMTPEKWKQVETLFEAALEREPEARAAFLDDACGDDAALRREVESLLAHQQPTGQFISTLVHDAVKLFPPPPVTGEARFIPGTVLATRYRIIGLLGRGGMGEVYRADDLKLGQPVALKFLPESVARDAAMLERFHREVRIARQISHPNVCRVFDIGEVGGHHFLSMEYIDGEDLSSLLRRIGRLPADKATEIARQLCAGLQAAHDEGVLHRDLKPANVMIDGRGKARITDFGLAGLADDFHGNEVRAGTPAYMAPEQLAGREVTRRSDLYALGLVLYEIFTGKKAFEATTVEELMRQQQSGSPPSISDYVKDVDPLVERVIRRCLERDPLSRPTSVTQVAVALPGSDPLAAALAAGETPSPEMVAAAPREGALRPTVAIICLTLFALELAAAIWLSSKIALHNRVPLEKSPEVLADRARGIVGKLAYDGAPADMAYGMGDDLIAYHYATQSPALGFADKLESGQPAVYYFWYRQSPRPLEALGDNGVGPADPPLEVAGMVNIILDTRGRLLEFHAAPPQLEPYAPRNAAPDWGGLLADAGLDPARLTATDSEWTPLVFADTRMAWAGTFAERPELPIRVEAAAHRGRLVYFQVIFPWTTATRQEEVTSQASRRAAGVIMSAVFFASLVAATLLARRNLRLGRGDRRGASKLALTVFATTLIGLLCGVHHIPTLGGELSLLAKAAGWSLLAAAFLWMIYMALEPYVRRRWPRLLISWSRLLAGDFRDPMVGRDVLVGSLLGLGHTLSIYSGMMMLKLMGLKGKPAPGADGAMLEGSRRLAMLLLSDSVLQWLLSGLGFLFLLLLLYILLRRQWLAIAVLWTLIATVNGLAFIAPSPLALWVVPPVIATLIVVAVARFGLLTTIAFQFFFNLSFHYVVTTNWSSWYAQGMYITLGLAVAVAVYSFYVALAGQPLFRTAVLQE